MICNYKVQLCTLNHPVVAGGADAATFVIEISRNDGAIFSGLAHGITQVVKGACFGGSIGVSRENAAALGIAGMESGVSKGVGLAGTETAEADAAVGGKNLTQTIHLRDRATAGEFSCAGRNGIEIADRHKPAGLDATRGPGERIEITGDHV